MTLHLRLVERRKTWKILVLKREQAEPGCAVCTAQLIMAYKVKHAIAWLGCTSDGRSRTLVFSAAQSVSPNLDLIGPGLVRLILPGRRQTDLSDCSVITSRQ